jgi:hypothetical protein
LARDFQLAGDSPDGTPSLLTLRRGCVHFGAQNTKGATTMKIKFLLAAFCMIAATTLWASDVTDGKDVTIKGTFVWEKKPGEIHDLDAKLTPTGQNEWNATWNFVWGKKPTTYVGVVKGDLLNGKVTGTGNTTEGNARSFAFEGTSKDGVITMKHCETTKGKKDTGYGEFRVVN